MSSWLSSLYAAAVTWRRDWYARDDARRRHLRRPVVSIGALSTGGSGKTPVAAAVARVLVEQGERPAILSRGYGRLNRLDGVTIVADSQAVRADFNSAGDEPLMLARMLPGVPVLVGPSRYLSGRLAEEKLGVTVHLLDDGFQHHELARDIDLLVTSEDDLSDTPLPIGRLREPLRAAANADAALVDAGYDAEADRVARALGLPTLFRFERHLGVPRLVATGETVIVPTDEPVFGLAGIARPQGFFSSLSSAGWRVVGAMAFRDHHAFTRREVARVGERARAAGARIVLTTDKDAVRLRGHDLGPLPVAAVPLTVTIVAAGRFAAWLGEQLAAARTHRMPGVTGLSPHRAISRGTRW